MNNYHPQKTPASNALTDLIRASLRLSALAKRVGRQLTKDFGISNAHWQTLGELFAAEDLLTVSEIARRVGVSRQATQKIVDQMSHEGFVKLATNPVDLRSITVRMTKKGQVAYQKTLESEWPFTNKIAANFALNELRSAVKVIEKVIEEMDA